ncbi:MmpS family protein [Mycobacterium intermedium]|uniref:MmpS family protein n=1 Tax=Mycobacterium intermedium TaxID=28445 RepID=A0A1E3S682_MYCIE|nr:MmpS family transport accessory protein [Mycobacterium intermedium]MCV6966474.1 MmpS family protein [Mycobacterium intermedium]ODQ97571.1 MmpS family protein [Mycobacterium intermedium]OPE49690.1 MmpS family protein [Mycobacterium intermedium]ORB00687.1 MmpS family protein [Mycobacterium intermedium]
MFELFKRLWIPLTLVVVLVVGGCAVVRIRGAFIANAEVTSGEQLADNSKPFNPKRITYEISAASGVTAKIDYLDEDGQPHYVEAASLPWSHTIVTTLPSMSANVVAQGSSDVGTLRCRVLVDGQVRDDRLSDSYAPFVYCLVKST